MSGGISTQAIKDLRVAVRTSYGVTVEASLSEDDLQEVARAILLVTAEHLKIKARVS